MNLFAIIVVGICIAFAQSGIGADALKHDALWHVVAVCVCVASAPLMAVFQSRFVSATLVQARDCPRTQQSILRRLTFCHQAVWAVSCLMIFCVMPWPAIVANVWNLQQIPVVYELVLLSPIVIALTLSWAAFYDLHKARRQNSKKFLASLRKRWAFVQVRLRLHLLMLFGPLLLLMLSHRFAQTLDQLSLPQTIFVAFIACLAVMILTPWVVTRVWPTKPIEDKDLLQTLVECCNVAEVHVHQIRRWKTGKEIINAVVAGVLPWRRTILLTDGLLSRFEPEEITAIVRHEAGHLRRKHLPQKMLFVILPLVALVIDSINSTGVASSFKSALHAGNLDWAAEHSPHIIALAFAVYLAFALRWLSHKMEFEADLFAAGAANASKTDLAIEQTRAALWRLSTLMPEQFRKSSMLHPSLKKRILLMEDFARDRSVSAAFSQTFTRQKSFVIGCWCVLLAMALI